MRRPALTRPLSTHRSQAVGPRSVVLNTHNGLLTSVEEEQGCHWVTPMCRQQHYVTTKEVTYRLPDTKVADRKGAPLMVSAILTYRIIDPRIGTEDA